MGLIDFFKGLTKNGSAKANTNEITQFEMFSAYSPVFRSWGGKLYESMLVRESVDAHARHAMKLKFIMQGAARAKLRTELLSGPNEFETWPAFLERCSNIYQTQNNLFISPILDELGDTRGFWPLFPTNTEVREKDGTAFLVFQFGNGKTMAMELNRIAVVKRHQLQSDFFGEPNTPLNATMEMDSMTMQGIIEGIKNASGYQFMAELAQKMFDEDVKKERERFDRLNFGEKGGRGLLLFNGNLKNVKQVEPGKMPVDTNQMQMIRDNVFAYFGTNMDILQNTADSNKLNAFYDGETEPFAIKMSEALTRMVYTRREEHQGNKIFFASNRLQYMNVGEKVNVSKELGDRGAIMIDEIRELFNNPPLPDGKGQHAPIRGEYYMADEGRPDANKDKNKDEGKKGEEQNSGGKDDE
ncbi:MAG: phage portal protein [Clostridia bacterium]|nr:phage portal protein [Clostridia bacterium]